MTGEHTFITAIVALAFGSSLLYWLLIEVRLGSLEELTVGVRLQLIRRHTFLLPSVAYRIA
jgi:hypothetical protein